ncbi:hypothetical protein ATCC90586_005924 [Pythium insidiosum]|nr:hypothetical protein ATCC90586_005924 [Pythium insidiosum]
MGRKRAEPDIEDMLSPVADCASDADVSACDHEEQLHSADADRVRDVREQLVIWYDAKRRKLPWRGDPPPYLSTATHTKQAAAATSKKKSSGALDAFVKREVAEEPTAEAETTEPDALASLTDEKEAKQRAVAPYETWVSEIMLQQTRVDTVVDYFLRWIEKFPTVEALANASEEDVNASWAGLGYYRRARMLHAGAKYVMSNFGGVLPSTTEELLTIPGIGPYTAGAISSIAFGNREPLVDGNVIRVVARLRAVGADPKNKQLINFSWKTARELVEDCARPGALNQALMELGATVCTVEDSDKIPPFTRRKSLIRSRLVGLFDSPSALSATNPALERRDLGELVHIFSHVKHHMGVEHLHFSCAPPALSPATPTEGSDI